MTSFVVLDPTNGQAQRRTDLVARPSSFHGLVVGYLDNAKANSDQFLDLLAGRLAGDGARSAVRMRKKHTSGAPNRSNWTIWPRAATWW